MLLTMTQSGKSNHSKNNSRRISQCAGCGSEILDQYILKVAPDLEWHASCLKCAECQQVLNENSTCFVRQDKTYCKRDYNRLFGARCRLCRVEFKENDLVMRAKNSIYHTECFRCVVCDRVLSSGDEFCIREKGIYCKVDIDTADKQDSEFNNNNNNNNSNNNDSQKTETASDETKDSCEDVCMVPASNRTSSGKSQSRSESRSRSHKSDHKATRVRTVLNERQLHMLRTCYGANPRPDALMKEQLVEMTGLSPRVIRVWFQNKRCKDKKRTQLLKQIQQQQQQDKGDPCDLDDSMWLKGKNNAVVNFSPEHQQAWMTSLDAHMFHPWKSLEHDEHSNPHHHHHLPHQQHQQLAFQQLMRNNFAISGDALCDDDDDAIVCLKESSHHNLMTPLDYSDDIYPGRDNSN